MNGFIVAATCDLIDEQTTIQLFGRLSNGQSFAALIPFTPYFFLTETAAAKHQKMLAAATTEKTALTTFAGERVVKVSAKNHQLLNKLASAFHTLDIPTYEADVKPHMRFLIDHELFGPLALEGDYETAERVERVYRLPEIKPSATLQQLKVVSLDTESSKKTGELFCIGLYAPHYQKSFLVARESSREKSQNIISCHDEESCLKAFRDELIRLDPDIITGWNLIDFDLAYLKERFRKHKLPFDLGRTNEEARLRLESNFFRASSADIPGRQVLDALSMIRDPFIKEAPTIKHAEFDSFSLEDVAQALLGEGKLLKGKRRHDEIEKLYHDKAYQKLIDYNMTDCRLAYDILEKTDMLNLAIERSQLTGLPLDRLGASVAAFDSLYLREARKRGLVSPTTRYNQKEKGITGGYVKSLKPGIYHNILVLDFKSLYPSIMRTFNIDPASFLEKKEKGAIESPNKAYFKNTNGILSQILERLHAAREQAKAQQRELANYAIKIILNSFFGVLANPNCRYYNYDMANAITHFGQMIIKLTASEIEKQGYPVIYMDTDSVFVVSNATKEKALALGRHLQNSINEFYQHHIKEHYHRASHLELEFEKLYLALMLPAIRMKEKDAEEAAAPTAAKKRYAGLLLLPNNKEELETSRIMDSDSRQSSRTPRYKEVLEIVGLEAIRGDWTDAAQDFQRELLLKVFHKEPPELFIKSYIKKLKEGKLDDKLIYRKSIRKELAEYTKTTPPHVKAARMLDSLDSNIISYVITLQGPEPLQKQKHRLDYEHYINKQIAPIANQVLSLFSTSFDDVMKGSTQKKLF